MSSEKTADIKRLTIALLGRSLDAGRRDDHLIGKMGAVRYRDAYLLKTGAGEAWLFEYGVLVGWDLPENLRQQLLYDLGDIIEDASSNSPTEHYSYTIDTGQPFSVQHDLLNIPNHEQLMRLALSHAFAQSAKLEFFEDSAQKVIQQNAHISKQLAATGKVPLSRRELAKLRGVLFDTSSDITLHFNLLDTPEFFWDYPELEAGYQKLAKYLDLTPRIEIMNKKLETIHELLNMLATEQHHKHSAFLEWIIIVLIAVDIIVYFL